MLREGNQCRKIMSSYQRTDVLNRQLAEEAAVLRRALLKLSDVAQGGFT